MRESVCVSLIGVANSIFFAKEVKNFEDGHFSRPVKKKGVDVRKSVCECVCVRMCACVSVLVCLCVCVFVRERERLCLEETFLAKKMLIESERREINLSSIEL